LFLLAIIISASTFRDYNSIEDVLAVRLLTRRKFRIMEWAEDVLDDLVFLEMCANGPTKKTKNEAA
jgi:hypothetical protein